MKSKRTFLVLLASFFFMTMNVQAQSEQINDSDKLVIVWTSNDPYLAERMVLMYAHAAKTQQWFNEVTIIVWGPSAKLVSENLKIQKKLKAMQDDGVEMKACIACASAYNVVDELKSLGLEVKGMGKPLTEYLKSDAHVLTF